MDRFANKNIETQTIYEIYRACRLCGAGGGYKMPIIQNVVNIDGCDVELKQKIRECVQIEVHQDDRMPPLICELCVDKVNDFYEFLEMCRQTNKRTRLRLGLPPQTMPRGAPDAGDCILGVTEPIYVNDEDSNEPLSKKSNVTRSTKFKKVSEKETKDSKVKIGSIQMGRQCRSVRVRAPTPPRSTRDKRDRDRDNVSLSKLQTRQKRLPSPPPMSILKKGKKVEQSPSPTLSPRLKRLREKDTKPELPAKRVKIAAKPLPAKSSKTQSASKRMESKESQSVQCKICKQKFKSPQAMMSHQRTHTVTFTSPKCACNACEAWFATPEEAAAHHKRHRSRPQSYRCRRCDTSYKLLQAYESHTCLPWYEAPESECPKCWKSFPTLNLLGLHRCPGISGRRGGKCSKCNKTFSNRKVLAKHENACKKGEVIVDPEIQARLRPIQVRVAKCDPLLANVKQEHYDVSSVDDDFGLDKTCVYPYSSSGLRIKSEMDYMVKINNMDFASYVHWDSDDSGDDSDNMDFSFTKQHKVESLTAWALKSIFSKKFLGKVPRRFRRLKIENIIDSALNDSLSDVNINGKEKTVDSDSVSDKDKNVSFGDKDDDDLFPKENKEDKVTNNDFDSLFNSSSSDKDLLVSKVDKVSDSVDDSNDLTSCKDSVKESNDDCQSNNVNDDDSKDHGKSIVTNSNDSKELLNDSDVAASRSEIELSIDGNDEGKENIEETNGVENVEVKSVEEKSRVEVNTDNSMEVVTPTNSSIEKHDQVQESNNSESTESNEVVNNNVEELGKAEENNEISEKTVENVSKDTDDNRNTISTDSEVKESTKVSSTETTDSTKDENSINNDVKDKESSGNDDSTKETQNTENLVNGSSIPDDNLNMDDLEDWSDSELDDTKLMADLDEQIGEKETQDRSVRETDKINNDETELDEDKVRDLSTREDVRSNVDNVAEKEMKD